MQPRTIALLEDIRDSIDYLHTDTAGMTFADFVEYRPARQLVAHNFEIIGVALNRLRRYDPMIIEQISGHQWIIGFRNMLVHGYDVIDYSTVWDAIHESLPVLEEEINALLHLESP